MSKITAALKKVETARYRTVSPLKIYEAKTAEKRPADQAVSQESGKIPFRVCAIAFIVSFLAVFALVSSAFTLARLDEQERLALDLQMVSEAQAAQIKEMAFVQQAQKEELVINFNQVEKVAQESHTRYTQVVSENNSLKDTVGDLKKKISLLSAEVSTLKSDNIILTNGQEMLHQKLVTFKERLQDIRNTDLNNSTFLLEEAVTSTDTTSQEGI